MNNDREIRTTNKFRKWTKPTMQTITRADLILKIQASACSFFFRPCTMGFVR